LSAIAVSAARFENHAAKTAKAAKDLQDVAG
jgi:hypothetical protein